MSLWFPPLMMLCPSVMKSRELQVILGTVMRSNSLGLSMYHTRMSSPEQVPNITDVPLAEKQKKWEMWHYGECRYGYLLKNGANLVKDIQPSIHIINYMTESDSIHYPGVQHTPKLNCFSKLGMDWHGWGRLMSPSSEHNGVLKSCIMCGKWGLNCWP